MVDNALKTDGKPDFEKIRSDFPALRHRMNGRVLAYLDSASSAQKPRPVIDALQRVYETEYANIHRGLYAISQAVTQKFEDTRQRIATFIGAPGGADEIVFTRNATEGLNLLASCWGGSVLSAGDEIILTTMEHHANIVPWQLLRDRIGIVIRVVPLRVDGTLDLDAYRALLSPRTRMVGVVHISNALGIVNDVKAINDIAKDFNPAIRVFVDGSQSIVHRPIHMGALGCDAFVFTGHKLYGPSGVGVLWARAELLAGLPPYQGGGDMIESVSFEHTTYKPAPARFEAGTPAIADVIALGAAVDYMAGIGMDNVAAHEDRILRRALDRLGAVDGLTFYGTGPERAGVLSFTAAWGHTADIAMILDQCGVAVRTGHHCCMPLMRYYGIEGTIRASLGVYTNEDDIEALVTGLRKAKELLA